MYAHLLCTSDNQFAYKSKLSCSHAIFTLRHIIDYHTRNFSTVNLCCVDVSKAFDKLCFYTLFIKLMLRKVPKSVIVLLYNWYKDTSICVQWGGCRSEFFSPQAGIRQGGILSPYLFNVYVDDMLKRVNALGCSFRGYIIGAIMYADDIVLISNSVSQLQRMLTMCEKELNDIDLRINVNKSACLRMGPRFKEQCSTMAASIGPIGWVQDIKYLGIIIKSDIHFKNDLAIQENKKKFYRSANAIFSKLGKLNNNFIVASNLTASIALPCLLYAMETLCLKKSQISSLEHCWKRAIGKLLSTFDEKIIKQSLYCVGLKSLLCSYSIRKMSFLTKMRDNDNRLLSIVSYHSFDKEIKDVMSFFDCNDKLIFENILKPLSYRIGLMIMFNFFNVC